MKRESRTPEGFVHMKTIEEMEEVNIYSDVSEQRSEWSFLFGLLLKHLNYMDLFSIQALEFIRLARRFYVYLQIYHK